MIEIKISETKILESDRANELEKMAQDVAREIIMSCTGDWKDANREIADFARNIAVYGSIFVYNKYWGRGLE